MGADEALALMQQRIDALYAQIDARDQRIAALEAIVREVADDMPHDAGKRLWDLHRQARALLATPPEA